MVDAGITSTIIEDSKGLERVAPQMDALCMATGAHCFNHSSFFLPWARASERKGKLCCIALWQGEEMVGFAPFFIFQDRKALFSNRLRFPANGGCPPFDIMAKTPEAALPEFKSIVAKMGWYVQDFEPCLVGSNLETLWAGSFEDSNHTVEKEPYSPLYKVNLPDDFDDALVHLKSRKRIEHRRLLKRNEDLGTFDCFKCDGPLEPALDRMRLVLKDSWKNTKNLEQFGLPYLEDLAASLFAANRLQLRFFSLEGQPVAYLMEINDTRGGWHAYHNGYVDGVQNSPGVCLLLDAIRDGIAHKQDTYYFWGDKDYTRRIANGDEPAVSLKVRRKDIKSKTAAFAKKKLSKLS